jgi:hypothetical protein
MLHRKLKITEGSHQVCRGQITGLLETLAESEPFEAQSLLTASDRRLNNDETGSYSEAAMRAKKNQACACKLLKTKEH